MTIDFHSHILPQIDDGSRSVRESVKILDEMAKDGVDIVIATPHFYCGKISIHRFLDKRAAAYELLKRHLKPEHPKILLGAEVLYNQALVGKEALTRLAIQGTNFILLEMPFNTITDSIINDVDSIASDRDVKVMIAHIERYLNYTSMKSLSKLMELNVLGQINCESLMHMRSRNRCFKLITRGYVHVMGTDMHRIDRGDAYYSQGVSALKKRFGKRFIGAMEQNGMDILSNKEIREIEDNIM